MVNELSLKVLQKKRILLIRTLKELRQKYETKILYAIKGKTYESAAKSFIEEFNKAAAELNRVLIEKTDEKKIKELTEKIEKILDIYKKTVLGPFSSIIPSKYVNEVRNKLDPIFSDM